jgi:serine/threonine protein kinase
MAEGSAAILVGDYKVECTNATRLGAGGFGDVYRGEHKDDSEKKVAIKIVKCKICKDTCIHGDKYPQQERDALVKLSHRNIVQFILCEEKNTIWYFITELCDCDLDEQFKKAVVKVPINTCMDIMRDVAEGLRHMHEKNLIHRDLKPANILVKDNVSKIGDFGLSRLREKRGGSDSDSLSKMTKYVGTRYWQAPEVSMDNNSFPVDIFSLALIFLAMICHKVGSKLVPFTGE